MEKAATTDDLFVTVYRDLRRLARGLMAEQAGRITIQPTALVHEAFLVLRKQPGYSWVNREQYFAVAGRVMRQLLADHFRRRRAGKRGGNLHHLTVESDSGLPVSDLEQVVAVHELLDQLEGKDPQLVRLVELRFFAGLTLEEAADLLKLTPAQAARDWTFTRSWLLARLQ